MVESTSITVLTVDDDRAFAELTADLLEQENEQFAVTPCSSVADGLSHLATAEIDCVVSDYDMPGQTGIDFLHAVRQKNPDLPFILFTGEGSEAVASDAFAGGATDYLQKEHGTDQFTVLANRITNAVGRYRAEQTMQRRAQAMSTAEEGIAIVGEDGRYIEVNDAYADLYGAKPDALTGKRWTVTVPETDVEQLEQEVFPQLHEHGQWSGEIVGQRADGRHYPKMLSLALLDGGGHVCVVRDVSDRKKRERVIEDLHATARALIRAENPDQIGTIAVDAIHDVLGLPIAAVHIYDESTDELVPVAWTDQTEDIIGVPSALGTDEGIMGPTFESGEVRVDDDISTVAERYNPDTDVRSQIILPLADHGVMIIGSDTVAEFDDVDVELARTVATHATAALDRIERERTLKTERHFIQEALDSLDDLFYVIGTDGTLRRWNTRVEEVTGYTETALGEMRATAFFPEDEQATIADAVAETLQSGEAVVEAELVTKDDRHVPYEFTGSRLTDTDGNVTGLIGIGRDISKRKMREEIVADLHDSTQDLITAPNPEAVANRAVQTAEQVLEQPITGVWFYESEEERLQPAGMTAAASSLLDDQPTYSSEESLSWQAFTSGELQVYDDLHGEPQRLNSRTTIRSEVIAPLGEYGVMNFGSTSPNAFSRLDISVIQILAQTVEAALERADREQQLRDQRAELERHNERLEKFANVVSHDLRNPLQVAEGRVKLAEAECDSEHLEAARDAHDRMRGLIEDLLTIAREGTQVKETQLIDLSELARNCWQRVETGDATLICETRFELEADPGRLKQLFENLYGNAVDHAGSAVEVQVGTLPDDVGFFVADDGPGIPAEDRGDVFDVGYSTDTDGTGFGLNIVKEVVDAHGWEITITDAETGGTRFEVKTGGTQHGYDDES